MTNSKGPVPVSCVPITRLQIAFGVLILLVIGAALIDITVLWVVLGAAAVVGVVPLIAIGIARDLQRASELFPR